MNLRSVSKKMSWLLRHCREPLYISLEGGWADVDIIVNALKQKNPSVTRSTVEQIVAEDSKGRYSFDKTGKKVRANYGHSIPGVVIEMETPEPPEFLYHGTATRFLDSIMKEGLKPMSRLYVHISPDRETAATVGVRHGKLIILKVRAKDFVADGHELFQASNGFWLTKKVPPEYLSID